MEDLEKGRGKDKKPRKRRKTTPLKTEEEKTPRQHHPEEGEERTNVPQHQKDADEIYRLKEENNSNIEAVEKLTNKIDTAERDLFTLRNNNGDYGIRRKIQGELDQNRVSLDKYNKKIEENKASIKQITSSYLNKAKTETMTNKLVGGAADGETVVSVARYHKVSKKTIEDQLKIGMEVESERTSDKVKQKELALDHIFEDVKYYTKLKKVEKLTNTPKGKDKLIKAYLTLGLELE